MTIRVGDLTITELDGDRYWISRASGEGMETTKDKLYPVLCDFFAREF